MRGRYQYHSIFTSQKNKIDLNSVRSIFLTAIFQSFFNELNTSKQLSLHLYRFSENYIIVVINTLSTQFLFNHSMSNVGK